MASCCDKAHTVRSRDVDRCHYGFRPDGLGSGRLTDPGQQNPLRKIEAPHAPYPCLQQHTSLLDAADLTDDGRLLSQRKLGETRTRLCGSVGRNNGDDHTFVGDLQRAQTQQIRGSGDIPVDGHTALSDQDSLRAVPGNLVDDRRHAAPCGIPEESYIFTESIQDLTDREQMGAITPDT